MVRRARLLPAVVAAATCSLTGCPGSAPPSETRHLLVGSPSPEGVKSADRARIDEDIDLQAYLLVYEQTLPLTHDGARLIALVERFGEEIAALERSDELLWAQRHAALDQWDEATRSFVEGTGAQTQVALPMIDGVESYLTRLSGIGSPELASAIASERKVRPPLQSLSGADMDAVNAVLFPPDRVFRDDFE
jgi:hypothetical protein